MTWPVGGTVPVLLVDENRAPSFRAEDWRLSMFEHPLEVEVGAIRATDPEGDAVSYRLEGRDAARFALDPDTGAVTTVPGVTYDYETARSCEAAFRDPVEFSHCYSVTVVATDSRGASRARDVAIFLLDRFEKDIKNFTRRGAGGHGGHAAAELGASRAGREAGGLRGALRHRRRGEPPDRAPRRPGRCDPRRGRGELADAVPGAGHRVRGAAAGTLPGRRRPLVRRAAGAHRGGSGGDAEGVAQAAGKRPDRAGAGRRRAALSPGGVRTHRFARLAGVRGDAGLPQRAVAQQRGPGARPATGLPGQRERFGHTAPGARF